MNITAHFVPRDEEEIIYFWFFGNDLPNDTSLESVNSTYSVGERATIEYESCLEGYPFQNGHPLWRKASMERRNRPTSINYQVSANENIPFESSNMRGLQIRQAFQEADRENTMTLNLNTLNYKDIMVRFAAIDEGAASRLVVDYRIGANGDWQQEGMITSNLSLSGTYQLYELDFAEVDEANNQEELQVRIRFDGPDMTADNGDRVTFNNISISGSEISTSVSDVHSLHGSYTIYPNPAGDFFELSPADFDGKIIIQDVSGRVVSETQSVRVNVSHLPSGMYFVSLLSQNGVQTLKLVKE
jgi:hypothetical protein